MCLDMKNNPLADKVYDKKSRDAHRFKKLAEYSNRNCYRKGLKDYHKLSAGELWVIAKKQRLICPISGIKLNGDNLSVDHITPISKGGSNLPDNVRLVHKWVNFMLHTHSDEEFFTMCKLILDYQKSKLKKRL